MNERSKNAETLRQAAIYLEEQDSGLAVVEVNDAAMERLALEYFRSRLPKGAHHTIDLKNNSAKSNPLSAVREATIRMPEVRVLFILNLHHLGRGEDEKMTTLVRRLNFNRESYSALGKILVFFFPTFFLDLVIKHAKDFYDFVPVLFSLTSETPSLQWLFNEGETADPEFLKNRIGFLRFLLETVKANEKKKSENLKEIADCQEQLADYEKAHGNYQKALEYWTKSLEIRKEIGDRAGEGNALSNVGALTHAKGDYDAALAYLEKSLEIHREIGDPAGEGATLNYIGQIYLTRGDYATALEYLERSLKIYRQIGDKAGEGATLNNIGWIYMSMGDDKRALEFLEMSLDICREIGDKTGMIAALHNMGKVAANDGDLKKAIELWSESLQLAIEAQNPMEVFNEAGILGKTLARIDSGEKAREYLKLAIQTGTALDLPEVNEIKKELEQL